MTAPDPPLDQWADRLEASIARRSGVIRRVAVVADTDSTQTAAARLADRQPGLMLIAGRQRAGRGRLGRAWADTNDHGLAVTFAIDGSMFDDGVLSLAAGVAACRTVEDALFFRVSRPADPLVHALVYTRAMLRAIRQPRPVGLRWPNDVVENHRQGGRKVAGVLIERIGPLALVGIGINVAQTIRDWPDELIDKAVSLNQLGSHFSRLDTAQRLLPRFVDALALPPNRLALAWRRRNVLRGTRHTFEYDGKRFTGSVLNIAPTSCIVLSTPQGVVNLPALATTLIHDQ